jgi:hypothetical protein
MRSVVDKVFSLQPVKIRSEELSVCLGSYLSGIPGNVIVDASGKEVLSFGQISECAGRNASETMTADGVPCSRAYQADRLRCDLTIRPRVTKVPSLVSPPTPSTFAKPSAGRHVPAPLLAAPPPRRAKRRLTSSARPHHSPRRVMERPHRV